MAEATLPVKRDVRRAFERAARTYDEAAVLQREVASRLLEHLDPIRAEPKRVLDLGCGTGESLAALQRRYARASVIGLDLAHAMLLRAAARAPWWRRTLGRPNTALVCADAEALPFAPASVDLVFSNLALQWCDPGRVFAECARILAPEGLFLFSTFGPDTLAELRAAFASSGGGAHVNSFIDMHDLGDALVASGFADPVMEMEVLTLEYADVNAVARGLSGRGRWARMTEAYERFRRNGALPATFEVVYGHAWKVPPRRLPDGRQVIGFHPKVAP